MAGRSHPQQVPWAYAGHAAHLWRSAQAIGIGCRSLCSSRQYHRRRGLSPADVSALRLSRMFAAYNAGPGRFDDFLLRQRPLPDETLAYVAKIAPGAETAFSSAGQPLIWPDSSRGCATLAGTYRGAFRVPGHAQRTLCAAVPAQSLKDIRREMRRIQQAKRIRGRAR